MGTKVFCVVNPASAGKKTMKEWPIFEKQLKEKGYRFDWAFTERPLHATEITREVLKSGYDLVISVGGDGTMNEVVNGFFEHDKPINEEAMLAVFSRGTGCDFIKTFGIKKGIEDFIKVLERKNVKKFDIGKVSYRDSVGQAVSKLYINISDVGLGGETSKRVNKTKKMLKGFFAFLIGALTTILKYKNKNILLKIDGEMKRHEMMNSVIVANAQYFGGGMHISPKSEVDDGFLDIIVLGNLTKFELIRDFHLIYEGRHLSHPKVYHYKGKHVEITSDQEALLEIDGEQPGSAPAEFTILPQAINVLI